MTFRVKWKGFIKYNFLPQNNEGCFAFLGGSYVSRGVHCSKLLPYARLSITIAKNNVTIHLYIEKYFPLNLECNYLMQIKILKKRQIFFVF
jgi:hypothetical protein